MACNIKNVIVQHLKEVELMHTSPVSGLYSVTTTRSDLAHEMMIIKNRLEFRYGVYKDTLPGYPFYIQDPVVSTTLRQGPRRDNKRTTQHVLENADFMDMAQTMEDKRNGDEFTRQSQIKQAEEEILTSMKNVAKVLKIEIEEVPFLQKDGVAKSGEAMVDFTTQSIQILTGKQEHIPEEVMHYWGLILRATDAPAYNSMLSRIEQQPEYAQVKKQYEGDPEYTPERIKQEAVEHVMLNRI